MSYSDLASHAAMIFDETRNSAYLAAMQAHIRPDTVVLDLGAIAGAGHRCRAEPSLPQEAP